MYIYTHDLLAILVQGGSSCYVGCVRFMVMLCRSTLRRAPTGGLDAGGLGINGTNMPPGCDGAHPGTCLGSGEVVPYPGRGGTTGAVDVLGGKLGFGLAGQIFLHLDHYT